MYRGCAIPDLVGTYFFSDYCSSQILTFKYTGAPVTSVDTLTPEFNTAGMSIVSFGEDSFGELYFVDLNGGIYKIVPNGIASACGSSGCCVGKRGNVNGTGVVDLGDLSALVSYLTGGRFVPACADAANVNGVGTIDLGDLSALVSFLTGGGFVLVNCP